VDTTSAPITGVFPLPGPWTPDSKSYGRLRVFTTALPFTCDMPRPNYPPLRARLFKGGAEVPFVNDPADLHGLGWFVDDGQIELISLEDPTRWSTPPELRVPELAEEARRRRWTGEGTPADYVRTDATVGGITRPGLHLPPGGAITFPVDVPAGATLDFGRMALPALIPGETATRATLTWSVDGEDVGHATVIAGGPPTEEAVSLAQWAGRRVDLGFRVDTGADGHAVVTAPTISVKAPDGTHPPRHVVVVGIDTLRQDALGLYGQARPTSPEFDAWAKQAVVFDAAWSPAPRTFPSFRTALSGRYPRAAATAPTIATLLAAQGFRTAGVVANVHLVPRFGFNGGFEEWIYENGANAATEVDRALAWQTRHADEDTFLFLHLMDPHTFYNAPEPYGSRFQVGDRPERLPDPFDRWQIYQVMKEPWFGDAHRRWIRAAYDGEVAYTSAMLGHFFTALDGIGGRTVTVVHSDHGEEFWDHDAYEHNHSLYEELVHAALWIRAPGGQSGARRIAAPVGLVDLVPTILDLVGAPAAPSDGRSLAAFVDPARAGERDALSAALTERPLLLGHLMFAHERWGTVWHGAKYILHTASGREELYDLKSDHAEKHDLAATAPAEELDGMRQALAQASGWPVRPGWRVLMDGGRQGFAITFAEPIADAGVIDPEAEREVRANLEWGEKPPVTPTDVAEVLVSDDRRTVRVIPGPHASGHRIWVSCTAACPAGTVDGGAGPVPFTTGAVPLGALSLDVSAGTLLDVPPDGEHVAGTVASGSLEALKQLGYIDGD
jgi:arylsulfatase A-like enzyme